MLGVIIMCALQHRSKNVRWQNSFATLKDSANHQAAMRTSTKRIEQMESFDLDVTSLIYDDYAEGVVQRVKKLDDNMVENWRRDLVDSWSAQNIESMLKDEDNKNASTWSVGRTFGAKDQGRSRQCFLCRPHSDDALVVTRWNRAPMSHGARLEIACKVGWDRSLSHLATSRSAHHFATSSQVSSFPVIPICVDVGVCTYHRWQFGCLLGIPKRL